MSTTHRTCNVCRMRDDAIRAAVATAGYRVLA
jgi:hypothetical protein